MVDGAGSDVVSPDAGPSMGRSRPFFTTWSGMMQASLGSDSGANLHRGSAP